MARHASSCRKSPSTSNVFGIFGGETFFYLTRSLVGVSDHVLLASSATCHGPLADYVHVYDACSVVQDTDGYCSIVYYILYILYIVYIVSIG